MHGRDAAALSLVQGDIERDGGRAMKVLGDVIALGDVVWTHVLRRDKPDRHMLIGVRSLSRWGHRKEERNQPAERPYEELS